MEQRILNLIAEGEKKTTEFKLCKNELAKSIYETVCAFLNTNGGTIILGVNDNREIEGVNRDKIDTIKKDFTTSMNNPQFINPTYILPLEEIEKDGKLILYIQVPESSEVHKYKNKIFIRNHEGDFDISNNRIELTNLYLLKQQNFTENKVYPYINIEEDLKNELVEKTKKTYAFKTNNNDWKEMSNLDFLKKNQLYLEDNKTKESGITLAGLLLFGTDFSIHRVLPAYRIDLLKRINDTERYDDREIIECNLIEAYYKCMDFIRKCLPNPFFLEGDHRVDLREIIFREVIANMLIHTEYSKNLTSWVEIYRDRVEVINGNRPIFNRIINIKNCKAIQKNPNIASVFRMLDLAEQIGSGTMKLYKYCKAYGGSEPLMVDENNFRFTLPIDVFETKYRIDNDTEYDKNMTKMRSRYDQDVTNNPIGTQQELQENSRRTQGELKEKTPQEPHKNPTRTPQDNILDFCKEEKSLEEIAQLFNISDKYFFKKQYLNPLIQQHKLSMTIPDKPTSKYQKYITIKVEE